MVDRLRDEATYELAHPRAGVVAAIRALDLQPGMRVLDAGCGPGVHLGLFADTVTPGGAVMGLDIRPERIALGRELHVERIAAGGIRLAAGDLHAVPADLGPFDLVWTSLVLHHEEQPVETLRALAQAVRPGGRVAVLDGDGGGSFPLLPWPPELELRLREAGCAVRRRGTAAPSPITSRAISVANFPGSCARRGLWTCACSPSQMWIARPCIRNGKRHCATGFCTRSESASVRSSPHTTGSSSRRS